MIKISVTREVFIQRLEEDVTPQDVVAAVIYFFGEIEFTTNNRKLHEAFNLEKQNPFLSEFSFREGGPYHYSELLDSVFSRLAISGLLGCLNPDFKKYTVKSDQLEKIRKSSLIKFSNDQKEQLRVLSNRIREKLL